MAASAPCCAEAEGLKCLLVLGVDCTSVLERWHLLAGLVVVIFWLGVFRLFALDLAERAVLRLASQGPP